MKNKIIGIAILAFVILGAFAYLQITGGGQNLGGKTPVTLKGYIGSEKEGLLEDEQVQGILKKQYGVSLDYSKVGSIAMVEGNTDSVDFLFPSSQTALEIFKEKSPRKITASQVEFNSPLVLYSWDTVTDALVRQGIVETKDGTSYVVDMPKLIDLIRQNRKWSSIGLSDLYGNVNIISTDPTQSNSGNQFAGLLANLLNNGQVVDDASLQTVLPKVQEFFSKQGYQQTGSGDLFEQYLTAGMGAYPLMVGYENQMIEFAAQYPEKWEQVKARTRILYPVPTVWSSHTLIALNSKSVSAIKALQDPEIQKLAWEKHGFRSGIVGIVNSPKELAVAGVPETINQVIQIPKPSVMTRIISALEK